MIEKKEIQILNANDIIIDTTNKIESIKIVEKYGNRYELDITFCLNYLKKKDIESIFFNMYSIKIFDERLNKEVVFDIIEKNIEDGDKLSISLNCLSRNFNIYKSIKSKVKLSNNSTLSTVLNQILYRQYMFDYRNKIGNINDGNGLVLVVEQSEGQEEQFKEYDEVETLDILNEISQMFNLVLSIDLDTYNISYINKDNYSIKRNVTYMFESNYTKFNIKIQSKVKYLIGRGKEGLTFSSINNGKDFIEDTNIFKGNIDTFIDENENDMYSLLARTKEELEKRNKEQYEIQVIQIVPDNKQILENFHVGDIINIHHINITKNQIVEQKVSELSYCPFNLYDGQSTIVLTDKKDTLIEYIKNAVKNINNLKKRQ